MSESRNSFEDKIYLSLRHYSNVHRGSGLFSMISTSLYEEARKIVLGYLSCDKSYVVIFCSPYRASELAKNLDQGSYKIISGDEAGLNIGLSAIAVKKRKLPPDGPFHSGGGTTVLVSADRVAWAAAPDRFEAGTPSIINVIAFARALQCLKMKGAEVSREKLKISEDPDDLNGLSGRVLLDRLQESVIGRNIPVPVSNGISSYVNLDYAASTPALLPAWRAYLQALFSGCENDPGLISRAKAAISQLLNAPAEKYDIIFTSNTTESINIVAEGTDGSSVLVSILEHNSNDLPWRLKHNVVRLPVDKYGFISQAELENILASNPQIKILAMSGASNVTGTCNDLAEISKTAHHHGVKVLIDAAQLIAHRRVDMDSCETDFLVFSGHKAYAPFGTGVLVARKGSLNFSDEEWNGIRSSGEKNVAGINALGESLSMLNRVGMDLIMKNEQDLLRKAIREMSEIKGIQIFGLNDPDSAAMDQRVGVISFFIKDVWPDKIAKGLAQRGIGIRYGCHCAHILVKHILNVSPRLQKFQFVIAWLFRSVRFPGVARISFGIGTTESDILQFTRTLKEIAGKKHSHPSDIKSRMDEYAKSVKEKVFGL
jgi:selenocysteine lyase/cysteine desulfurase